MIINVFNSNLQKIGVFEEMISFIWIPRYWQSGEFKLLARSTEKTAKLFAMENVIIPQGKNEAGVVEYINISLDEQGFEQIEVKGRFVTSYMDRRIVQGTYNVSNTTSWLVRRIVFLNAITVYPAGRTIPQLTLEENPQDLGDGVIDYTSEPWGNCLAEIEKLLMSAKLGFRAVADVAIGKHTIEIYKGVNRTAGTDSNIVFSRDFNNLLSVYKTDSTNGYHTCGWVIGKADNSVEPPTTPFVFVEKEAQEGLSRREVKLDGADIDPADLSETESISAALRGRGLVLLGGMNVKLSFDGNINTRATPTYGRDFDVGDVITVRDDKLNASIDLRITAAEEIYENGAEELRLVFGETIPTRIR
jgi:hypothetical protein